MITAEEARKLSDEFFKQSNLGRICSEIDIRIETTAKQGFKTLELAIDKRIITDFIERYKSLGYIITLGKYIDYRGQQWVDLSW